MCAAAGIENPTNTVTVGKQSIIPKVRVDWMILHVGAYSAGTRGEKSGSHSPFPTSNNDWLLQSKSPIRKRRIPPSLITVAEEGAGRTKPGDPTLIRP